MKLSDMALLRDASDLHAIRALYQSGDEADLRELLAHFVGDVDRYLEGNWSGNNSVREAVRYEAALRWRTSHKDNPRYPFAAARAMCGLFWKQAA